jgi:hypothetical protein
MNVLVACEFSGVVRRAFRERGHDAWSCDLVEAEDGDAHHIRHDCLEIVGAGWDLVIAHPPCTYLCSSGARWWAGRRREQEEAIRFFLVIARAPAARMVLENPIGILSTRVARPTQIIQPWMFGHGETKATCLWLKNLPPLVPTDIVAGREQRIHHMSSSWSRERSRTYHGIAQAMAEQWGKL